MFFLLKNIVSYYKMSEKQYFIPKIIHQIWLGPNKRPDIWIDSWRDRFMKRNPHYKYMFWSEKEISKLKLVNQKIFNYEPSYPGKSDIARYEILNKYGGIFVDADSLWIEKKNNNFDKILKRARPSGMFAAVEPVNKWSIANGVIGFTPNHPILHDLIHYLNNNYIKLKKKYKNPKEIWMVTGPYIFKKILDKYHNKLILESYYFYPSDFHNNNLWRDPKNFKEKYPNSIMFQYGYSTNNNKNNNIMKKYIENN